MNSKIQFFSQFYSLAKSEIETYGYKCSIAELLEDMYESNVQWHKENDERVYRESLSLEQLARMGGI